MMEFTSDVGRVVFRPIGYRQLSIELDFKEGAGQQALDVCRRALATIFDTTDTLIVRGYIASDNKPSRAFGAALGFSTVRTDDKYIEKRMTKARWRHLNEQVRSR